MIVNEPCGSWRGSTIVLTPVVAERGRSSCREVVGRDTRRNIVVDFAIRLDYGIAESVVRRLNLYWSGLVRSLLSCCDVTANIK